MNTFESRMADAASALAQVITDDGVPPLELGEPRRQPSRRRGRLPRRAKGWLIPVAAAAAVVGVITAPLAIFGQAGPPSRAGLAADVPAYYVYVGTGKSAHHAEIIATATGHIVAAVRPPRPYLIFQNVTAAADDRTFVLEAWTQYGLTSHGQAQFFRLSFSPQRHTTALVPLLRRPLPEQVYDVALSPDGTRLAFATEQDDIASPATISILTLATGVIRSWSNQLFVSSHLRGTTPAFQELSWTAGGELQYVEQVTVSRGYGLQRSRYGVLDPDFPGGVLPAGRVIPAQREEYLGGGELILTPRGYLIGYTSPDVGALATAPPAGRTASWGVSEYAMPDFRPVNTLGRISPSGEAGGGWWASATGSTQIIWSQRTASAALIAPGAWKGAPGVTVYQLGILGHGHYQPLPTPVSYARAGGFLAW